MATDKPDLTRIWANGAPSGNIVDPDMTTPGKVNAGWQAEVPPFEHFNFLQKWFSQGLAYLNEQGIGTWDSNTTYPVDGLTKGSDGKIYTSIVEQSGNDPISDNGVNWVDFNTRLGVVGTIQAVSEGFSGKAVISNNIITARGWFGDKEFGGGDFVAEPSLPKNLHDGGIYISPTVPKASDQPGSTWVIKRDNFINGVGETDPGGNGVFVRLSSDMPRLTWFGGVSLWDTLPAQQAKNAVQNNPNEATTFQYAGNMVIGDRPSLSVRDAFQVSRYINGQARCNAFSDNTVIQSITDSGGYSAFYSEIGIEGTNNHSYMCSFHDRGTYKGSGYLGHWGNFIQPHSHGAGTINVRNDIDIYDVSGTGGTINNHTGVYIRNLTRAISNTAISLEQHTGYAVYAPNGGMWELGGRFRSRGQAVFGNTTPVAGAQLTFSSGGPRGIIRSDSLHAIFGVEDGWFNRCAIQVNGGNRLVVENGSSGFAVRPGDDNSQALGNASYRWSQVYAANGAIQTSDRREKQQIKKLNKAEMKVAIELKSLIRKFKFTDSVEKKGDKARTNIGVIAQEVKTAFESEGLDAFSYGLLCFDTWEETVTEVECDKDHPDAYPVVSEVQKTEKVKTPTKEVKIIKGKPVMVEGFEYQEQPIMTTMEVFDESGNQIFEDTMVENEEGEMISTSTPMTHEVPVMEEVSTYYRKDIKPAGELYGIRYEQLLAFIIGGM